MNVFLQILFLFVTVIGFARQQMCQLVDEITNFEEIRKENLCYIDKTNFILKMFEKKMKFVFIARPRKFGKSLFCKTIRSVLWGKKHLFEGLKIYDSNYDWTVHPVIYLDFSTIGPESETSDYFRKAIVKELQDIADQILVEYPEVIRNPDVRIHADTFNETDVPRSLENLVLSLRKAFSNTVGIVIDEYDSTITRNLKKPEVCDTICEVLHDFYACVKGLEDQLRFVFITGVARFTQSYLFSSMNKLHDISFDEEFSEALGFTAEEIKLFAPEIEDIVEYKKNDESTCNATFIGALSSYIVILLQYKWIER